MKISSKSTIFLMSQCPKYADNDSALPVNSNQINWTTVGSKMVVCSSMHVDFFTSMDIC